MATITSPRHKGFLFGRGNSKLGNRILTFSIPAVTTCPGRSELCETACYATKGWMAMSGRAFAKRLKASKKANFVARAINEILRRRVKTVRIHVSGDFYSPEYVQKWRAIVEACPEVRFYAYTRSWRVPDILLELKRLSCLRNMQLWFSCDSETDLPKKVPRRVRLAYMAMDDTDTAGVNSDLVFRVRRDTVVKRQEGVLVCPAENGITDTTCQRCRLCISTVDLDPRRYSLPVIL